jgi:hypothetical protein
MKGRYYSPAVIEQEEEDVAIKGEVYQNTFKFPLKEKKVKKFKVNTREFSPVRDIQIRFMWKTSIPYSWFKLANPGRFYNMAIEKQKQRNTLNFLEETQKYIYNIRKPLKIRENIKTAKAKNTPKPKPKTAYSISRVSTERKLCSTAQDIHFGLFKCNKQELLPRYASHDVLPV